MYSDTVYLCVHASGDKQLYKNMFLMGGSIERNEIFNITEDSENSK